MKYHLKRKSIYYKTKFDYEFYNTWHEFFLKEYGLEHSESVRLII